MDLAARIHLALNVAKTSIDVASYDVRGDRQFTVPFLKALREAAERGVKVRFLVSNLPQAIFDPLNLIPKHLLDPPLNPPVEYMIFGGRHSKDVKWGLTDGMHEKLFVVDGRIALFTGRGLGDNSLSWLDTSFVVKGALAAQSSIAFEDLWKTVASFTDPMTRRPGKGATPAKAQGPDLAAVFEGIPADELAEVRELISWFDEPSRMEPAPDGEPRLGRLLHFDFIKQMLHWGESRPVDLPHPWRHALLDDPIVNALVASIQASRSFRLTTLSYNVTPELSQAVGGALARKACAELLINGNWRPGLSWMSWPVWNLGLPHLDHAMQAGARAYALKPGGRWQYLHRKLAVVGDRETFFGSHNFNFPSTVANDEMTLQVRDRQFAGKARGLTQRFIDHESDPLDPRAVHRQRVRSGISRFLFKLLQGLM